MDVSVIGAGSWGTTVASLATRHNPTVLWARRAEVAREVDEQHTNEAYLPGYRLPDSLRATDDLQEAARRADVLVMGVPSHGFRETLDALAPYVRPWVPVVSLTKGLEQGSLMRMTSIVEEVLPGHPAGVLTGPNLAKEIMSGCAAASVIGMADQVVAASLQDVFRSGLFRVYRNDDVVGCELGGALKNVIAIAAGIAQALTVGDNTRAMVITRGLAELSRLGTALGGRPETLSGLAGMGDLLATCLSPQSRNRHVGEELGKGRSLDEIVDEMSMVAEGVKTVAVAHELAARHGLEMPIVEEIYGVVHGGRTPEEAFAGLRRMRPGHESDGA